jgi:hypothetical protein
MAADHVLVAHQPAYLPWPGYFSRLLDVRRLVLLDHVQYTERGWQNRNYVCGPDGERLLLTVPVRRRFGQPINQVRIADERWRARHWRTLTQSYTRAPYWSRHEAGLRAIYGRSWERLADLNEALIRLLLDSFGLDVDLQRSSTLAPAGRRTGALVDLCRQTRTRTLRVGAGALGYLDADLLRHADVSVEVATYRHPHYDQGLDRFVPGLSALDLLLHRGPYATDVLAEGSDLRTWAPHEVVST